MTPNGNIPSTDSIQLYRSEDIRPECRRTVEELEAPKISHCFCTLLALTSLTPPELPHFLTSTQDPICSLPSSNNELCLRLASPSPTPTLRSDPVHHRRTTRTASSTSENDVIIIIDLLHRQHTVCGMGGTPSTFSCGERPCIPDASHFQNTVLHSGIPGRVSNPRETSGG